MNNKKLNQLLWHYHKELKLLKNFSEDTVKTYISCVIKYFDYAGSNLHIDPLQTKAEHLFEFILYLKKYLSPSRVTHFRAALKRFFTLLFYLDIIGTNPAENLLSIRRIKSKLIDSIDTQKMNGKQDLLMILLLWCLGLRSGEMLHLRKNNIKIIDQEKRIALITIDGKGAKQRALMAVDKLFDLLTEFINPLKNDDLLFPDRYHNKAIHDTTVNRRIKKYADRTNIYMHITAHCLRHSFATEMYYENVPLEAIRTMLGHENLAETSNYIHVNHEDITHALSLLSIKGDDYAF